jgi:hypothetical protein
MPDAMYVGLIGLVVIIVIILSGLLYYILISAPAAAQVVTYPPGSNTIIDTLKVYSGWKDASGLPYVLQLQPNGQLVLGYYDNVGYEQGVSQFTANVTLPNSGTLVATIVGTIKNYSGVTPDPVWTFTIQGPKYMTVSTKSFTKPIVVA